MNYKYTSVSSNGMNRQCHLPLARSQCHLYLELHRNVEELDLVVDNFLKSLISYKRLLSLYIVLGG